MKNNLEVRDLRNGEWSWVYNSLVIDPHLTPNDKTIYMTLATYGGMYEIRPSLEELAKNAGVGRRSAIRCVQNLIKLGYVAIKEGGGRGRCNVYLLLKQKGCRRCTVSKTVPNETLNSAKSDIETVPQETLHKDKEINIKKDIAASAAGVWSSQELTDYLNSMIESKNKALNLIVTFWSAKGGIGLPGTDAPIQIGNKIEAQAEIKRNLRAANDLIKTYPLQRVLDTIDILVEYANFSWTMETIGKLIVNSPEKIKESLVSMGKSKKVYA